MLLAVQGNQANSPVKISQTDKKDSKKLKDNLKLYVTTKELNIFRQVLANQTIEHDQEDEN